MSLINDVLQDLDKRNASGDDRRTIPNDVRPLPGAQRPRWRVTAAVMTVLGISGLALIYIYQLRQAPHEPNPMTILEVKPSVPAQGDTAAAGAAPIQNSEVVQSPAPVGAESSLPASPGQLPANPADSVATANVVSESASPTSSNLPTSAAIAAAPAIAVPPAPTSVVRAHAAAAMADVASPRDAVPGAEQRTVSSVRPRAGNDESSRRLRLEPVLNTTPAARDTPGAIDELSRAQTMLRLGRVDEAEPILRQLLQTQPRNVTARQALLAILLPAKRHADAAVVFREGLQNNPEQVGWAMSLARLQVEAKDPAAALETLAFSRAHAVDNADYLAFSGTVMQRLGRNTDAVAAYDAALRLRPQEARWWVGFGIALEGAGRARDALEAFSRAKSLGGLSSEIQAYVEEKLR